MSTAVTIIVAVLGSTALATLIQFFVNRHDLREGVQNKLTTLEKDVLRTQLLLLVTMRPQEKQEIMTVAEHYFGALRGNWYMTSIFNKYIEDNQIAKPDWFNRED